MFDLEQIIRVLSNFSVCIPIIVYFIKFKNLPRQNHVIGVLVITSMVFDVIGLIRFSYSLSNIFLFNSYYIIWYVLLTIYYYLILFRKAKKQYFKLGIAVVAVGYTVVTIFAQGIDEYQSYAWTIISLVLASYGIIYTSHQVKNTPVFDRNFQSKLFINGGIVVFTLFSFFLFVFDQYLLSVKPEIVGVTWSFHNVNNIVKNIVFAIGLYYSGKSNISLTEKEAHELKKNYPGIRIE
jgi:hypothetical protein